ncbi:MAG: CPBP family intramembrane metalloprotease [Actinomycetia bacterium]|nr:CPBP family intramembrane metalloprotease [Actinomycetes bacterium]
MSVGIDPPVVTSDPLQYGWGMEEALARAILLTFGLVWLTVFALAIVRHEEGDLRWDTVKRRLRLNPPCDPETRQPRRKLWWWLAPLIVGFAAISALGGPLGDLVTSGLLDFLSEPSKYSLDELMNDDARLAPLEGAWWLLAIFVPLLVFNIIGEELIFRGVLLPKMHGVFGRWAWVANGVLFAFYHLHQPWGIAVTIIDGALLMAWPAQRFRSTTMAMIVHGAQVPFILALIVLVILGAA